MEVAEFFAGIGLVRMGLEQAGFNVVWANDISPVKRLLYCAQYGEGHFLLRDVRELTGDAVPAVALATASFPCIDLSLAGNRSGLRHGPHSSTFWEFVRLLSEQGSRRPAAILVENVTGFLNSHQGEDLHIAIKALNDLGYICDLLTIDARHFVPQSRPRLFIVGSRSRVADRTLWKASSIRSSKVGEFVARHPALDLQFAPLPALLATVHDLGKVVERLPESDARWWTGQERSAFEQQLRPIHAKRLETICHAPRLAWATAYRRTRESGPAWEIRDDGISGCLRAVNGGSSRQALIEAGQGNWRVRWMMGREYARLQGAPEFPLGTLGENQVLHAFGDAVCVPVIAWLGRHYLYPLLSGRLTENGVKERLSGVG